jgi:hypothetical protein
MTALELFLMGLLLAVVGWFIGPKIFAKFGKYHKVYPPAENYHVVELNEDKRNTFWFRVFPERKVQRNGTSKISLSSRKKYILVCILPNGNYEYTTLLKGDEQPIPHDWKLHLDSQGLPSKGFPQKGEMDALYTYQSSRRQQTRPRRRGYPTSP